jgi:hypothetical protein
MDNCYFKIESKLIVAAALLFAGSCSAESPSTNSATQSRADMNALPSWGKEVDGLRSRIWTDENRFNTDEPIHIHYAIQNVSKHAKTVWHNGFAANNRIEVTSPDGAPAKLIDGTGSPIETASRLQTLEKSAPFLLQPGQIDDAYVVYNLRDFFEVHNPGTYTVVYVHQEPGNGESIQSNALRLVIEVRPK